MRNGNGKKRELVIGEREIHFSFLFKVSNLMRMETNCSKESSKTANIGMERVKRIILNFPNLWDYLIYSGISFNGNG